MNYSEKINEVNTLRNSVSLEKDIFARGLVYFNEKYEEIQAVRDRILNILVEAIVNKAQISTELSKLKQEYEGRLSSIMIRDDVKPLKSADLRLAMANHELSSVLEQIANKERELTLADAYYKAINIMYDDVKNKNENLSQQLLATRAMLNIDPALKELAEIKLKEDTNKV